MFRYMVSYFCKSGVAKTYPRVGHTIVEAKTDFEAAEAALVFVALDPNYRLRQNVAITSVIKGPKVAANES